MLPFLTEKNIFIVVALIALFFLLRVPFLNRGLSLEESTAISSARGILQYGFPYFDVDMFVKKAVGVGHPPMLNFLLASSFWLFGVSEAAARFAPLLLSFLTFLLMWRFSRDLFDSRAASILSLALFAVIPFSVQNSLQIQYDGAIIPFFVFLLFYFAWQVFNRENGFGKTNLIGFYLAWVVLSYSKPEVWALIFATLFLFTIITSRDKQGWKKLLVLAAIAALAAATYLTSYYLYASAFGHADIVFGSSFSVSGNVAQNFFAKKLAPFLINPAQGISTFYGNIALIYKFILWLTIPVVLLVFIAVYDFFKNKQWQDRRLLFLWLWLVVFVLAYAVLGHGGNIYPRYFGPAIPALCLLLGSFLAQKYSGTAARKSLAVSLIIVSLIAIFKLGPYALPHRGDIVFSAAALNYGIWLALVLGVSLLVYLKRNSTPLAVLTLFWCVIVFSAATFVIDARADYNFGDNFGESGYKEAGEWLNRNTTGDDIVLSRNPIDYYFKGNLIDTYNSLMPYKNEISKMLFSKKITYLAIPERTLRKWYDYDQQGGRFVHDYIVAKNLPEVVRFGSIIIYKNQ